MTVTIENTNVDTVLNIAELTTASLTGTGVFDVLLQTLRLHLDREFQNNRITGTAYATVYSQALTAILQQSVAFCLSKAKLALELEQLQEQVTLLQKQQAQVEAQTSLLDYDLATVKPVEVANLTKQGLLLESQKTVADNQASNIVAETAQVSYRTAYILPEEVKIHRHNQTKILTEVNKISNETIVTIKQAKLVEAQKAQVTAQTAQINAEVSTKLPVEVANLTKQGLLVDIQALQVEAQTALLAYDLTDIKPSEKAQITAQTSEVTYRVANLLPAQVTQTTTQTSNITAQTAQVTYTTGYILPSQLAQTTAQTAQITYNTANTLPAQLALTTAQKESADAQTALYEQKVVTETAQAVSTPATGSVMGVQNALMVKQAENYDRDAEQKAAKLMLETINVRFTADSTSADFDYVNHLSDADVGVAVSKLITGIGGTVAPPPTP